MKYIKTFESHTNEDNESLNESFFLLGAALGVPVSLWIYMFLNKRYPFLSTSFFKNIYRWYKVSGVIKKYDKLIRELDLRFKNDPKLVGYYNRIKKLGDNSIGFQDQTHPTFSLSDLRRYIINNSPANRKAEIESLFSEMREEIIEIVPDVMDCDDDNC